MAAPLEKELQTYEKRKQELLADEGKFVVIHGEEIIGIFAAYEDALKAGYLKCGVSQFLVKQISAVSPVNFFTRELVPAS